MKNEEIAKKIYKNIIVELKTKKITQNEVAKKMKMSPQTFSDNIIKLSNGNFPKIEFLLKLKEILKIEIGISF